VRELEHVINRSVLRASFGRPTREALAVDAGDLDGLRDHAPSGAAAEAEQAGSGQPLPHAGALLADRIAGFERDVILAAVKARDGNWAAAARDLGLDRSNLHHRARRLGLKE
jgi:anaerobic nitric oxide reductase transcription regulator